jgi:hypothetical protein
MDIIISHHSLSGFGGTETYVLTIGPELQRLGHRIVLYSATPVGPAAEIARQRGLAVVAGPAELPSGCDVLIAQDASTAMSLAARFPQATRLYVAHSDWYSLQVPPQIEGLCDAIVVMSDRVQAQIEALAYHPKIVRLRQPIDLKRFGLFPPRADDGTRRALLLSNYLRPAEMEIVAGACRAAGFDLTTVGYRSKPSVAPELDIAAVDVVIGYGRSVIEALASRRAAYVYGISGGDGWVTPETYGALEADGFGGRGLETIVTPERLASDLRAWDRGMGEINRRLAAQHHDVIQHVNALVALSRSLGLPRRAALTSTDELARLVRLEYESWGRYMGAIEELHGVRGEIDRQRAEIADLKAEAERALQRLEADRATEISSLKAEAESMRMKWNSEVQRLETERAALRATINRITTSRSWRLTSPLRYLKRRWQKIIWLKHR